MGTLNTGHDTFYQYDLSTPRPVLHVAKWGLTAVGIFAGMCGAGYMVMAIIMDKILNQR